MVLDVAARQVLQLRVFVGRVPIPGLSFPAKRVASDLLARARWAIVADGHARLIRPLCLERDRVAARCRESHHETAVSARIDVSACRNRCAPILVIHALVDGNVPSHLEGVVRLVMHHLNLRLVYRAVVISARQKDVEPEGDLPGQLPAVQTVFLIVNILVVWRVDPTTAGPLADASAARPEVWVTRRRWCRRVLTRSRQE